MIWMAILLAATEPAQPQDRVVMVAKPRESGIFEKLRGTVSRTWRRLYQKGDPIVVSKDEHPRATSLEVLALLQELNESQGITIVLVTHEPDIAACAKRVVTMRDGRVRSDLVNKVRVNAQQALSELPPVEESAEEAH